MGVSEERGKSNIIREVDFLAPKARVWGVSDAYSRTARDDAAKPLVFNNVGTLAGPVGKGYSTYTDVGTVAI